MDRLGSNAARLAASRAMDRYADGDAKAFATLYDALAGPTYRLLLRLGRGDRALAEDLLQQTFLRLHRARGTYVKGADVFPWVSAIARRTFLDEQRRRGRARIEPDADVIEASPPLPAEQDALLDARALLVRLATELAALPRAQREAFELIRGHGLSIAEAAAACGVSENAVKLRAHRAYRALRQAVAS